MRHDFKIRFDDTEDGEKVDRAACMRCGVPFDLQPPDEECRPDSAFNMQIDPRMKRRGARTETAQQSAARGVDRDEISAILS